MMNGWVILRAVRSALREWPTRIALGWRRSRSRVWISDNVVVTGSSSSLVMPEYLEGLNKGTLTGMHRGRSVDSLCQVIRNRCTRLDEFVKDSLSIPAHDTDSSHFKTLAFSPAHLTVHG